jgi:thiol-disulfide isomerase/thioredoxin
MMYATLLWLGAALAAPELIPEKDLDLVGRTAPSFEAVTLDGDPFSLEATRGKPVVLAFWASWCGPCRGELPELSELQAQRDDIAIYAVNVDRDRRKADAFLRQVKVDLPVVWDNQSLAMGQYDVLSMPTTFVLDAQGTVKLRKVGYSSSKGLTEILAALEALK